MIIIRQSQVWLRQRGSERQQEKIRSFSKCGLVRLMRKGFSFSPCVSENLNILQGSTSSFYIWRLDKTKKENGPDAVACGWPLAEVKWDGKEKVPDLLLHDYSEHSHPSQHHYKVLERSIKKDWIYETPHKFKQEPENYKIGFQIFFYLVCACSVVFEACSLILSHLILVTTLWGKQAWLRSSL